MHPFQNQVSVRKISEHVCALDFHGDLNSSTEDALMAAHNLVSSNGADTIILNFENLSYMNSSGIGLLVTLLIRAKRRSQRLFATHLNAHYRQIFHLTRLEQSIPLIENEQAEIPIQASIA